MIIFKRQQFRIDLKPNLDWRYPRTMRIFWTMSDLLKIFTIFSLPNIFVMIKWRMKQMRSITVLISLNVIAFVPAPEFSNTVCTICGMGIQSLSTTWPTDNRKACERNGWGRFQKLWQWSGWLHISWRIWSCCREFSLHSIILCFGCRSVSN